MGAPIQAVLPHPTDPNTMYVGGQRRLWVTRDGGTSWTPLSDKQRSLSIASLGFDPTDATRQTLIAGIGITSNGVVGGAGMSRVAAASASACSIAATAAGPGTSGAQANPRQSIVGVAARGSTLLAAAAEPHVPAAAGGLYRSVNGGGAFELVSGSSGLETGPVSSLAGDTTNHTSSSPP